VVEKDDETPANQPPALPTEHDPKQGPTPTERFWDFKASHSSTAILTCGILIVSFGQYTVYRRQAAIMATQTHISNIQGRPWIKVVPTIAGPLRFSDWNHSKSIDVPVHFGLNNYGPSPAVAVRIRARLVRHPGNPKRSELSGPQEETCNEIRRADPEANGTVDIVPSQPAEESIEQELGLGGIYKTDEPILFAVVGCAVYTFAETERGETGFRMVLGRVLEHQIVGLPFVEGPPEPYRHPPSRELLAQGYPAAPPNVGLMQADEVIFRSEDEGNYAK
jgi:hypothetical protein